MALATVVAASLCATSLGAVDLAVRITSPEVGEPVFGEVEIEAAIGAGDAAVDRIEFFVDYQLVEVRSEPPWRVFVDIGEENVEHSIEVVAHPREGEPSSSLIVTPAIRVDDSVDVRLRQLFVTVTRGDERVLDLERDDFEILDDGRQQRLVTFQRGEVPFAAVLLVDASSSMVGDKLSTAVGGARRFTESMGPLDEAKLLLFSDRRLVESDFTNVGSFFALGLAGLDPGGGTALNDALVVALERLRRRKGRRVAVLLSDGVDVDSAVSMRDVSTLAQQSEAVLYWIRLARPGTATGPAGDRRLSRWRDTAGHQREIELLEETIVDSGGRVLTVSSRGAIAPAFDSVVEDLRGQYVLGYHPRPEPRPGDRRSIDVRVDRGGAKVRAPDGYVAVE